MTKYKFLHQSGGFYYWKSVLPVSNGDSRHELISCPVEWFWANTKK
jgi:hypothetical protein